jgi:hypothetical protein
VTFEAAIESGISDDMARIMALASLVPDYFEFNTPAAHAQRPDPKLKRKGLLPRYELIESAGECYTIYREAYEAARSWHHFYFEAAMEAIRRWEREKAAFLLGYALHNTQDLPSHGLMPNILHSVLNAKGKNPDDEPRAIELAKIRSKEVIAKFKETIGDKHWAVFISRAPLGPLGKQLALEDWSPGAEPLPPRKRQKAFWKMDEWAGIMETDELRRKIVLKGLLPREETMRELLSVSGPGKRRSSNKIGIFGAVKLSLDALRFKSKLPRIYNRMSEKDQLALVNCWEKAYTDLEISPGPLLEKGQ